jgi:Barrel-sandwich domain of CusB or HlyD membrane-fusion
VASQRALLKVLYQQKSYQRVVAPFDGVITQRNIDVGSLVQADATSGTFMFTIMQGNVIRTQVYVPQDQAIGLSPGVDAVVRMPEIPGRTFPGKVTRIADALQPGTRTLLTEVDIPALPISGRYRWRAISGPKSRCATGSNPATKWSSTRRSTSSMAGECRPARRASVPKRPLPRHRRVRSV